MSIQIQKIQISGRTMEYFCFGTGSKTMVILPGISLQSVMNSADAVAEAYRILTDEFTVYLFERPTVLPEVYTIYDAARDTAEAFRLLGLHDIYLFGVSMGGMIAQTIACEYPELIRRMIIGSTTAKADSVRSQAVHVWAEKARAHDAEALLLGFGEAVYPPQIFAAYRDTFKAMAAAVTDAELERFAVLAEGVSGFDITGKLHGIRCPVLLIAASDDAVLGPDAYLTISEQLQHRKDFRLYIYGEGYGHAAYDTAPDYKERILDFFTEQI